MQNLIKRLQGKGWTSEEITKAVGIIEQAKQGKDEEAKSLNQRVYWVLLTIIIIANFSISIALIPIFIALNGIFLYITLAIMGLTFGFVFEIVIRSIEHLETSHHITLAFLIPAVALANVFVIVRMSNDFMASLGMTNYQKPLVTGAVYAASFVVPYLVSKFVLKIGYYSKE